MQRSAARGFSPLSFTTKVRSPDHFLRKPKIVIIFIHFLRKPKTVFIFLENRLNVKPVKRLFFLGNLKRLSPLSFIIEVFSRDHFLQFSIFFEYVLTSHFFCEIAAWPSAAKEISCKRSEGQMVKSRKAEEGAEQE